MADTDKINVHVSDSLGPLTVIVGDLFVHRITRRRMKQQKRMFSNAYMLRHWQLSKPCELVVVKHIEVTRTHRCGHLSKSAAGSNGDTLGDRMIVVSAHEVGRMRTQPVNAWRWRRGIVDRVAEKNAGVEVLVDRRQRRPIGMNIGEQ